MTPQILENQFHKTLPKMLKYLIWKLTKLNGSVVTLFLLDLFIKILLHSLRWKVDLFTLREYAKYKKS